MLSLFTVLFHPRRRRRHRWRNIWGKYLVLLWVHRGLAVLFRLEHRRCRAGQPDRVDLWDRLGRDLHLDQVHRFDHLVLVVRRRLLGLRRRASMASLELDYRRVLFLRPCPALRVVRWGQVDQVGLLLHPFLDCQGCHLDQVLQVRRADHLDLVDLVGMVCTVVE